MLPFIRKIALIASIILIGFNTSAKDYSIVLSCDPDGASVTLNGMPVSPTTPAIIEVPAKQAQKTMMFHFTKAGYKSKTVTVSFNKKQH